jgi:hypothetical protein
MKDFIPYELALELKQLGFDKWCYSVYDRNSRLCDTYESTRWQNENPELITRAPLYQQAFRWFREKYSLHADIGEESDWEENNESWSFDIYKYKLGNNDAMISNCETFNTYEEAELECLIKLIEIVKTK